MVLDTAALTKLYHGSDRAPRNMQTFGLPLDNDFNAFVRFRFVLRSKRYDSIVAAHDRNYPKSRTLPL